jgi:hypothetical protein
MNVLQNISGALDGHLNTLADLPPVAWQNSDYSPTQGTTFLSVDLLTANTDNITVGYAEEHVGVYQIMVVAPAGEYKAPAQLLADTVANHFLANRQLTFGGLTVKITTASFNAGFVDGAWYQIPVTINYRAYIQR